MLKVDCLERGRIAVALLPVGGSAHQLADQLYAAVLARLVANTDPFVTFLDRSRVQATMNERLGTGMLTDQAAAIELGQHLQAKYMIALDITAAEAPSPTETTSKKKAWKWNGTTEEYTTDTGNTRKRAKASAVTETNYTLVSGRKTVRVKAHLQVTLTASSAIVESRSLEAERSTSIEYGVYGGDLGDLYSGKPGKQKKSLFGSKYYAYNVDADLFKSERRQYGDVESLWEGCVEEVASEAGSAVLAFIASVK